MQTPEEESQGLTHTHTIDFFILDIHEIHLFVQVSIFSRNYKKSSIVNEIYTEEEHEQAARHNSYPYMNYSKLLALRNKFKKV